MPRTTRRSRWTAINIAALVLGFIVWWPIGIAVLAWILWGSDFKGTLRDEIDSLRHRFQSRRKGKTAFDDRRNDTPTRGGEHKRDHNDVHGARDREEFDRFMARRGGA